MKPEALIAALVLTTVYLLGDWLQRRAESLGHRRWLSFAAGVSVAYVFMDVLPELSKYNQSAVEIAGEHPLFGAQRIYGLALASFVILYGLDHLAAVTGKARSSELKESEPHGHGREYMGVLQVAGFAVYSWLIGYLLVERAEKGLLAMTLYVVALGLHFLIIDHTLREKRGAAYRRLGRWVLAASVPLGALAGQFWPISQLAFARCFAVIAGGMVMTSAQAELPTDREGRFWPFCGGSIAYAILLMAT